MSRGRPQYSAPSICLFEQDRNCCHANCLWAHPGSEAERRRKAATSQGRFAQPVHALVGRVRIQFAKRGARSFTSSAVVAAFVTVVWLREQPRENQGWTSRLEDPYKPLLPMDAEFADIKTKLRRWRSLREEIEEIAKQFADQHDGKTTEEASTYCQPHF